MNFKLDPMPSARFDLSARLRGYLSPSFIGVYENALAKRGYIDAPTHDAATIWRVCSTMPEPARAYLNVVGIACAFKPAPSIRETFALAEQRRDEVEPMLSLVTDPALKALGEVLRDLMLARYETLAALEWLDFGLDEGDVQLSEDEEAALALFDDRVEQRCAVARAGLLTVLGGYDVRADPTVNYLLVPEPLTQAAK